MDGKGSCRDTFFAEWLRRNGTDEALCLAEYAA